MNYTIYRLYFDGPLHISDVRSDYGSGVNIMHSDSFYAALIAAMAKIKSDVLADLGCTISSLFPFTSSKEKDLIYFFPKPLLDLKHFTSFDDIKKLKRIEWLDKDYFQKVLNGSRLDNINEHTIKEIYLTEAGIEKGFITKQVVPRVAVPRSREENDGDTNIFYIEKTYFKKGSGLYFLLEGDTKVLEKALNVLQHEGIGTDRNVGFGHFTFEKDEKFSLKVSESSDFRISLSLFNPGSYSALDKMLQNPSSAWEVVKRGGWVTSDGNNGVRKKSVYMFKEGSIFYTPELQSLTAGKVDLDLKPDNTEDFVPPGHPVWRCGRSIFLPIKIID